MAKSYKSLAPKKSLGQNFLSDPWWIQRIVQVIAPGADDTVLEIGPGKGVLTEQLLPAAGKVVAVEIDGRMVEHLGERFQAESRLELVHADFLKFDLNQRFKGGRLRIVGNLPYHVTSAILFRVLDEVRRYHEDAALGACITDFTIMIQKEVAQRILSGPGESDYGILSVFVHQLCNGRALLDVPPAAFFPRPKVMSTILQLSPLDRPRYPLKDWDTFRRLVRGSFNQRRKMLRRSLRDLPGIPDLSTVDGLEPWLDKRPDSISPEDFVTMANLLADHQPPSTGESDHGES